ncbi:MAG: glutaredoxin family protein [Methylococcaceae bacterium]|nr:glutaredoxin family protein [Methylococcaceae bacterium]
MTALVVYSTPGCHLCEQAEVLLQKLAAGSWHSVDIAGDDQLLERYGVRIPVVRRVSDGAELNWPFDLAALDCFIHAA